MNAKTRLELLSQLNTFQKSVSEEVDVFEDFIDQSGSHPENYRNFECGFAAEKIREFQPERVLDIGTNRLFLAGLSSRTNIDSVDIRSREIAFIAERFIIADSKKLAIEDNSYDFILSLNAIEHFGLGRYGDEVDEYADVLAFKEWRRVLKPGGVIVFSTTVSSYGQAVAFNAHRIYTYPSLLSRFGEGMQVVSEKFYSNKLNKTLPIDSLNTEHRKWDIYAGCWRKMHEKL